MYQNRHSRYKIIIDCDDYVLMLSVQEPRYYFCFKRTTVQKSQNQSKNTSDQSKTFDIRPSGYAKISTPIEKLSKIIGDILLPKDERQQIMVLNPLAEYFVFRIIAYDFITPEFKLTSYKSMMKNMFESAIESIVVKDDKTRKRAMLSELSSSALDPIFQNYMKDPQYPRWKNRQTRANLLLQYEKVCSISKQKYKESYMSLVKNYLKQIDSNKCERDYSSSTKDNSKYKKTYFFQQISESQLQRFVAAEFEEVDKIQVLKRHLQIRRARDYTKRHRGYFNFQFCEKEDRKNAEPIYSLTFNAISKEEEPVLLTLQDYLEMRDQSCNYEEESEKLIVDLLIELHKYRSKILENNPQASGFYHYLSPTSAIIDQLSLQPRLSFLPCVLDAFGLQNKPQSIELKLTFSNTPKTFDYFQSENELSKEISSLIKDTFYGNQYPFQESQVDNIKKAKQQNKNLALIYQSICVDRFLLLSYFVLNNKPFGKNQSKKSTKEIKDYFQRKLKKKKHSLSRNRKELKLFVGQKLVQKQLQQDPFHFTIVELSEMLNRRPYDSEVEKHRFNRFYSLTAKRHLLIREITHILNLKHKQFTKITKPKKYILVLYVFYLQVLLEYAYIYKTAKRSPQDYVQIYDQLNKDTRDDPFFHLGRNIISMLDKVNRAIERNGEDRQDSENNLIKKYSSSHYLMNDEYEKHKNMYQKIKFGKQNKKIKQELQSLYEGTIKRYEYFKDYIFEYLFPELNVRYANSPNSLRISGNEQIQAGKQVIRRLQLIIFTFVTISEQNLAIYDTLVLPALNVRKENIYKQHVDMIQAIKLIKSNREKEKVLYAGRYVIHQVDDIIGYTAEMPKIYRRLKVPMGRWFIDSDFNLDQDHINMLSQNEPESSKKTSDQIQQPQQRNFEEKQILPEWPFKQNSML